MTKCKNCNNGVCQCDAEEDFISGNACDLENKEECESCQ